MEEEKQVNKKKKNVIVTVVTIMALLLVIVGVSYAFWQLTKVQEDTNIISSGCFGVNLEGNEAINLTSAYPMRTEEGMKSTPYTFTITNTCSGSANYIVNLESLSNTTFASSSIRVALNDTNKLYSEYEESTKYFEDSIEARTLISGTLQNNESVTYNLRMWIDESAPSSEQNKIFASKIVVTSGQEGAGIDPEITDLSATSTIDSITITYNANGDITPAICKYGLAEGTYDNTIEGATASNCSIIGLNDDTTYYYQICTETGKGSKCVDGEIATKAIPKPFTEEDVGKYVSMTPTATSYSIATSVTGYDSDQTINPSELNLWRVIKVNSNGTVEMVSDKVSSKAVYFQGKEGYINFIGGLNTIAAQYTDGKHVQSTRHIGYSNQTQTLTDTSKLSQTSPWTTSTDGVGWTGCTTSSYLCGTDEAKGAGDREFTTDYELVNGVYGTMEANKVGTSEGTAYWLASRRYRYNENSGWYFNGRLVNPYGSLNYDDLYYFSGTYYISIASYAVRPIVTLKSTSEKLSGSGTEESPYQLN